jgi:hypothetical protein
MAQEFLLPTEEFTNPGVAITPNHKEVEIFVINVPTYHTIDVVFRTSTANSINANEDVFEIKMRPTPSCLIRRVHFYLKNAIVVICTIVVIGIAIPSRIFTAKIILKDYFARFDRWTDQAA